MAPYNRYQRMRVMKQLGVVYATMLVIMIVYELLKSFMMPAIVMWQSYIITIIFVSLVMPIVVYFTQRALKYKILFDTSSDAIMMLEPPNWFFTSCNPATLKMFGAMTEAEFTARTPYELSPKYQPDGRLSSQKALEMINAAMEKGSNFFEWTHKRINGEEFPATVLLTRVEVGKEIFLQATVRDITEHKKAEEMARIQAENEERKLVETKLRSLLEEKETLLHELNHRVNNNLQLISNLASLQRRLARDEKVAYLFDDIQRRIRSIALVHEKLYLAKGFSEINLSDYLKDLAHSVINSFFPMKSKLNLKVDVEYVRMDIERSVTCGLIINEVLSNALKYAFSGNRDGEISLSLHKIEGGNVMLTVSDNGVGIPSDKDPRTMDSLGMKLIFSLSEKQLGGTIVLDRSSGTSFKIIFKEISNNYLHTEPSQ